jgi:hypothetical protein
VGKSRWWPLAVVAGHINSTRFRRDGRVIHEGGARGGGLDVARGEGGRAREGVGEVGEVENGARALDAERGDVVRARGHLRAGEGAETDARLLARLPDLRHPLPPCTHPHAAVRRRGGGARARLAHRHTYADMLIFIQKSTWPQVRTMGDRGQEGVGIRCNGGVCGEIEEADELAVYK